MRIARALKLAPMIAASIAIAIMPLGARAGSTTTITYYGPDNSTVNSDTPCLRGGTEVERRSGGVCFNVSSGSHVSIVIQDASGVPQNAEYGFLDSGGYATGSDDFCGSKSEIAIPLDSVYLEVRLVPQTGVAMFGGKCPPQTNLPQFHGISVATTGTVTATFS